MLRTLFACVATALLVSIPVRPAAIQGDQPTATDKVTITGWALNMSNVATGTNQTIQITIDRWSTPAQRQLLIDTFMQKKQDGLLRELEKQPRLGRFNFPGYMGPDPNNVMRLGTDINYARSFTGEDGGRQLIAWQERLQLQLGDRHVDGRGERRDRRQELECAVWRSELQRHGESEVGRGRGTLRQVRLKLVAEGRDLTLADRNPERRAQAAGFGARPVERLWSGHFPLVLEAVGRPEGWREAFTAAAPGGCVVYVGGCPGGSEVALLLVRTPSPA